MRILLFFADWMTSVAMLVGLAICLWAFMRSHKFGYIVIAVYFALMLFKSLFMPIVNRKVIERWYPDHQLHHEQTMAAIDDIIQNRQGENAYQTEVGRIVEIEVIPIILVFGLWLVAKKDAASGSNYKTTAVLSESGTENRPQPSP